MRRISKLTASVIAALALFVAAAPAGSMAAGDGPQQLRRADDVCKKKPTRKARKKCRAKHEGGKEDGANHQ